MSSLSPSSAKKKYKNSSPNESDMDVDYYQGNNSLRFLREVARSDNFVCSRNFFETRNPAYIYGLNQKLMPTNLEEQKGVSVITNACVNPDIEILGILPLEKLCRELQHKGKRKFPFRWFEKKQTAKDMRLNQNTGRRYYICEKNCLQLFSVICPENTRGSKTMQSLQLNMIPEQSWINDVCYLSSAFEKRACAIKSANDGVRAKNKPVYRDDLNKIPLLDLPSHDYYVKRKTVSLNNIKYCSIQHQIIEKDIKKFINDAFRREFPQANLSLTKLRSLKLQMYSVSKKVSVSFTTVCYAMLYFEKLVYQEYVAKSTRKLIAACCLLIAIKTFEDHSREQIPKLIQSLCNEFRIPSKSIAQNEFMVLYGLNFGFIAPKLDLHRTFYSVKMSLHKKKMPADLQQMLTNMGF